WRRSSWGRVANGKRSGRKLGGRSRLGTERSARGGLEADAAGEAMGRALDEEVEEPSEEEGRGYGENPSEVEAEIRDGKAGVKFHTLPMYEVERIAPGTSGGEPGIGSTIAAVSKLVANPEIGEDAEGNHGKRNGDFELEIEHLGDPAA